MYLFSEIISDFYTYIFNIVFVVAELQISHKAKNKNTIRQSKNKINSWH